MVVGCSKCKENRNKKPAEQFYPVEIPENPFQKVAADIFQHPGIHYLILIDYHSKWPCVLPLHSLSCSATVIEFGRLFSELSEISEYPKLSFQITAHSLGRLSLGPSRKKTRIRQHVESAVPAKQCISQKAVQTIKNFW